VLGLDDRIAGMGDGGTVLLALVVAVLLGLRHATDPDHLTAVSSLILAKARGGSRRAAALGLAWGLGHASTLVALGVPFVLYGDTLPAGVERAAEIAIGALIVALALAPASALAARLLPRPPTPPRRHRPRPSPHARPRRRA
jgi:high-affinity nickel permease